MADPKAPAECEAIAIWMVAHGYATGHGDTIEDMLAELEAQAKDREADTWRFAEG